MMPGKVWSVVGSRSGGRRSGSVRGTPVPLRLLQEAGMGVAPLGRSCEVTVELSTRWEGGVIRWAALAGVLTELAVSGSLLCTLYPSEGNTVICKAFVIVLFGNHLTYMYLLGWKRQQEATLNGARVLFIQWPCDQCEHLSCHPWWAVPVLPLGVAASPGVMLGEGPCWIPPLHLLWGLALCWCLRFL